MNNIIGSKYQLKFKIQIVIKTMNSLPPAVELNHLVLIAMLLQSIYPITILLQICTLNLRRLLGTTCTVVFGNLKFEVPVHCFVV